MTGAPDGGGYYFPSTETTGHYITLGFSTAIGDGAGDDLHVWDAADGSFDPAEKGDVYVSTDGAAWTLIGSMLGGTTEGYFDLAGLFSGPVWFVKLVHIPMGTSDGIDLDTIKGLSEYAPVPIPGAALLLGSGLIGLAGLRRRFMS